MIKHFLLLLIPFFLIAESTQVSSIPLPTTYIQLIDIDEDCDNDCLQEYLLDGQIFTFLALADDTLECMELEDERMIYIGLFNIGSTNLVREELKIAMILPYKLIGRYAYSTSNAVFAYLLTRNHPFVLKNFQIDDESPEEIERVLNEIKEQEFHYVIAPLTPKGARAIVENEEELNVYFPTINKNDLNTSAENIYFGAIDYKAQIAKLSEQASSPLVVMYDKSAKGKKLYKQTKEVYMESELPFKETGRKEFFEELEEEYDPKLEPKKRKVIAYGIDRKTTNLKWHLEKNKKIQFGTFFLNTPVIKSTMIISQLTTYDTNVTNILSTQINYDPLMFSMTQKQDRDNMYIANSVNINNNILIEANSLLTNDIVYDWINYASTVGADYFYHAITHTERAYQLPMLDNQILYPISIVKPSGTRFEVVEEGETPVLDEDGNVVIPSTEQF
jgi:SRSO17 transposase